MDVILNELAHSLPPIITRQELERLTGGLLKARTLANLDSAGRGPSQKIRYGRKIAYERKALLAWLARRMEVESD